MARRKNHHVVFLRYFGGRYFAMAVYDDSLDTEFLVKSDIIKVIFCESRQEALDYAEKCNQDYRRNGLLIGQ